jgi:CheY-like chemotaxis protein
MCASVQMKVPPQREDPSLEICPGGMVMGATNLARACARPGAPRLHGLKRPGIDSPLVLVVDDDPFNQLVAAQRLSLMGIKPLLASDGAEAVALACGLQLDLILMDLKMPVLDGFAATAQIRCFELEHSRRRVPVVAHTSTLVCGDLTRLRDSGFDAVLEKPAGARAMRDCVMRWCPVDHSVAPALTGQLDRKAGQAQFSITEASTRSPS